MCLDSVISQIKNCCRKTKTKKIIICNLRQIRYLTASIFINYPFFLYIYSTHSLNLIKIYTQPFAHKKTYFSRKHPYPPLVRPPSPLAMYRARPPHTKRTSLQNAAKSKGLPLASALFCSD